MTQEELMWLNNEQLDLTVLQILRSFAIGFEERQKITNEHWTENIEKAMELYTDLWLNAMHISYSQADDGCWEGTIKWFGNNIYKSKELYLIGETQAIVIVRLFIAYWRLYEYTDRYKQKIERRKNRNARD